MMIMFPLTFLSNAFVPTEHPAGLARGVRRRSTRSRTWSSAVRDLTNDGAGHRRTSAGRCSAARSSSRSSRRSRCGPTAARCSCRASVAPTARASAQEVRAAARRRTRRAAGPLRPVPARSAGPAGPRRVQRRRVARCRRTGRRARAAGPRRSGGAVLRSRPQAPSPCSTQPGDRVVDAARGPARAAGAALPRRSPANSSAHVVAPGRAGRGRSARRSRRTGSTARGPSAIGSPGKRRPRSSTTAPR